MSVSKSAPTNFGELDRLTLALYVGLVAVGWLMIYAVNYDATNNLSFLNLSAEPGKQLFFIVVCFALLFVLLMTDWSFWRTFSALIYLASLVLLIGPVFIGREVNGALAWYHVGGFTFQPVEIAKFGACLAMAGYLSGTSANLREWRSRFIALGIMFAPVLIIALQNDTGSALVFFSFLLVLYREGLTPSWYVLGFGSAFLVILSLIFHPAPVVAGMLMALNVALINRLKSRNNLMWSIFAVLLALTLWWKPAFTWFLQQSHINPDALQPAFTNWMIAPHLVFFGYLFFINYWRKNSIVQGQLQMWLILLGLGSAMVYSANFFTYTVLAPHQQVRIKIWLRPWEITDTRGAAYNLLHSKMAIGSGGFFGKGFHQGNMTQLSYVPEQSTDFIFCTIGEEHGFLGVFSVIVMFAWLLIRLTVLAERQRSNFSRIYMYSVVGILFVHFIVNVGMTMGLFPTIGIPLPFISYGGSSLIGFTLMIGVALKLDNHRNFA